MRKPLKTFEPRGYQTEVFEVAMKRNTIAVLDTGTGKTMIAVMLIRETGRRVRDSGGKVLMVFLAPTVDLVHQQYEVIRDYTEFNVAEYYGEKGVDEWTDSWWKKEMNTNEIMVMTPQILLDALRHGFMPLCVVQLLIFDECHRANGSHPYANIMKGYFHKLQDRPTVFGMTASPVIRKGVSSVRDCQKQISELESILDSKTYTSRDRGEIEIVSPSAREIHKYYDPNMLHFVDLKTKLETLLAKIDASLVTLQESPSYQFKDTSELLKAARKNLMNYHGKVLYCLDNLGLVCAREAAKLCMENVTALHVTEESDFYLSYLKEALSAIEEALPHEYKEHIDTTCGYMEGSKMGFVSPKLNELVQIFLSIRSSKDIICLIFVERIITAKVIEHFLKRLRNLSELSISHLTGGNSSNDALTPKVRRATLDMLRSGKVNLMFTTDVAEEGIHVPNCSFVVRFDLPKTVRSYVQSRGRARQSDSRYILMIERGNVEQVDQLFGLIQSEFFLKGSISCRDSTSFPPKMCSDEINAYCVESTGATVTADSGISLIYKYCEKLPGDRFFIPQPAFQVDLKDGLYECILTLPPNAVFQRIVGPPSINSHVAKQLVSLEACKKLHELGALNDHLLPFIEETLDTSITDTDKEYISEAGTTKRKELHGMTRVHALSGTWAHEPNNVNLNAYEMKFVCDQEGENYSGFVLLLEATLDDDVAGAEIELFLFPNKVVKTSLCPRGKVQLSADQVEKSKLFQEFFFNGIFGRLITGSKSSGVQRKFLFKEGKRLPWSSLNMYLLLPLESSSPPSHDTPCIHWKGIDASAATVNFLRKIYSIDGEYCLRSQGTCNSSLNDIVREKSDIVHLANKSLYTQFLRDSVVMAVHNGRFYSVLDVMTDITSESPFDEINDAKHSQFNSFTDYYREKYSISLQHPGQPLLLLKQSHNPHNLLFSKSKFVDGLTGQSFLTEKEQVHAHIPPELLVHIDLSNDILKSFYLLPSVMYRLESLMLACQLRAEIGYNHGTSCIPSFLILEAISTSRCCENFSLERLELLGDSVLKYVLSCHLFLNYPNKHEGQLSDLRSNAVCNSTLHKLGIGRSLQGYIRYSAFDPRRWVAPGQISLHPFPCGCGVDAAEVPLDKAYMTEDTSIAVGVTCDKGHRWMCSKTIADCVEALIGAYYIGGGLNAAVSVMKWLHIDASFEIVLVEEAKSKASQLCYLSKVSEIEKLESVLGYSFSVKGLLLEAITHPSYEELGIGYCYQRLEFLGDSALDLVITTYLYRRHTDVDPGELTDLRSASASNENFAEVAIRHHLQQYLQHGSGVLLGKIKEYVKYFSEYQHDGNFLLSRSILHGPKVLGDMVESIAGALLIDTYLDLDKVWEIFKPLLSPIITPDKLELPPLRELIELCGHLGFFINTTCTKDGDEVVAELTVQLKDDRLVGCGHDRKRKAAKAQAALFLLNELKRRGISHAQCASKRKNCSNGPDNNTYHSCSEFNSPIPPKDNECISRPDCPTKPEIVTCLSQSGPSVLEDHYSRKMRSSKLNEPVILPVAMQKGGPRTALFELCRIHQWPLPKFELIEQKFRHPVILNGVETPNFNMFTSHITLHIPNTTVIQLVGDPKTDKKSANDSSAFFTLHELQKAGRCILKEQ